MPLRPSIAASLGLIGTGAVVCSFAARPLTQDPALRLPPNPLGIKMSPYGEVIAMAMQGPIERYFHGGAECTDPSCTLHDHHSPQADDHGHGPECDHDGTGHAADDCDRGPACTHDHRQLDPGLANAAPRSATGSLRDRYRRFLEGIGASLATRTNPKAASTAHRFQIRRKVEDQLRFAYTLDPSHYGNYTAYHFFLTEPELGTRPELTTSARQLSDATVAYCLAQTSDPRPALTAAAAAANILELMFGDPANYSTRTMRDQLALVDHCLARYRELLEQAVESGQWQLVSPFRQDEASERHRFLCRVRDAAEQTIRRLEGGLPTQQASH